jgi:pentatricopeptide repeat protein
MWGVLGKMNEIGVPPSSSTYSLIIARFVADGNLELALEYLNAMKARGTVPELRVAQSIIILAARQGYPRLALDLAVSFEKESVRRLEHEAWMNCLISCTDALYVSILQT